MVIDFDKVVPIEKFAKNLKEEKENFFKFLEEAKAEINFYDWCVSIQESYVGMFYSDIVGVFLFKIEPLENHIDEWIWVIVGDLPPIYITCEDSPNPVCALDSYIGAMREWVETVEKGNSVEGLVPVEVPATFENAASLKSRLEILDVRIVQLYADDLKACTSV